MTQNNLRENFPYLGEDETLEDRILYVVRESLNTRRAPKLSDRLQEDLNMDSLDAVELGLLLEETFNRDLGTDEAFGAGKVKTVQDLVKYVGTQLNPEARVVAHQAPKSFWNRLFGQKAIHQKED